MKRQTQLTIFAALFAISPFTGVDAKPRQSCKPGSETLSCEARCVRSLAGQCLITHIDFEGRDLVPGEPFITASFLTCKNADVDLQIKNIVLALDDIDNHAGAGIVDAKAVSDVGEVELRPNRRQVFEANQLDGRKPLLTFTDFINSGTRHVDVEISLAQCGATGGGNSCSVSGKLVAVTNPNIRCDYHDTSGPGAFIDPETETPSDRVRKTIGRFVEQ